MEVKEEGEDESEYPVDGWERKEAHFMGETKEEAVEDEEEAGEVEDEEESAEVEDEEELAEVKLQPQSQCGSPMLQHPSRHASNPGSSVR